MLPVVAPAFIIKANTSVGAGVWLVLRGQLNWHRERNEKSVRNKSELLFQSAAQMGRQIRQLRVAGTTGLEPGLCRDSQAFARN